MFIWLKIVYKIISFFNFVFRNLIIFLFKLKWNEILMFTRLKIVYGIMSFRLLLLSYFLIQIDDELA